MKARGIKLSMIFILLLAGISCENEVNLNAPKKDITAAYGVLDGSDPLHFIKVNKAFLPKRNAEEYASENYSDTYYDNISVSVLELDQGGDARRTFVLKDTLVKKKSGLFESDELQTLYYFEADDLDPSFTYQLRIQIDEGGPNEKLVKGRTDLVGAVELNSHNPGQNFGNELYFYSGDEYKEEDIEWTEIENAREHSLTLSIHYSNIFSNGDTVRKTLDWKLGTKGANSTEISIDGESFYQRLSNNLSPNPEGLSERKMKGIVLEFRAASEEIRTYTTVAGPSSSIVQHRPNYTNLDTAAVGIFGSARHRDFQGLSISDNSMEELIEGDITGDLKFAY